METVVSWTKWALATIGGLIVGFLGGWDVALKVLVIFVILDYITGVTAAYYEKKLNSDVGFWGITKKIFLFVPVAIGYWVDVSAGTEIFRSLAIFFYLANEGLSVLENLGRLGVPIPSQLQAALEQLRKKAEESHDNGPAIR